jgi:hypothetical protein
MHELTDTYAQSNVDLIEGCLNASPETHASECEEERWFDVVGERPAFYLSIDTELAVFCAVSSWAYWSIPEVRAAIDELCPPLRNDGTSDAD